MELLIWQKKEDKKIMHSFSFSKRDDYEGFENDMLESIVHEDTDEKKLEGFLFMLEQYGIVIDWYKS